MAARHCYKCGREIGPDETICAICNRAGMATPSATQYHGTIVVAIVTGVVIMAAAPPCPLRRLRTVPGPALRRPGGPPGGGRLDLPPPHNRGQRRPAARPPVARRPA